MPIYSRAHTLLLSLSLSLDVSLSLSFTYSTYLSHSIALSLSLSLSLLLFCVFAHVRGTRLVCKGAIRVLLERRASSPELTCG